MSDLFYSSVSRSELKECADLAVRSFLSYEYFTHYFPDEEQRRQFMSRVISSEYRTTFGNAHFLAARKENRIVAVSQLFPPTYKKPSDLQYMLHGWWRVLMLPDQKRVKEWLQMDAEAGQYCHSLLGNTTWYISSLTVDTDCQGQGVGSDMLMKGILPYISSQGGTHVCFFTNSESNLQFYTHLGFQVVDERHFMCEGHKMGSWSFLSPISELVVR